MELELYSPEFKFLFNENYIDIYLLNYDIEIMVWDAFSYSNTKKLIHSF